MRIPILSCLTLILSLAPTPSIGLADQFVLFDVTFDYSKSDADSSSPSKSHYYVKGKMLNENRPKDWTVPVDYRNGTVHVRLEVIEKPLGDAPTTWSVCYIPNKGQKNGYGCLGTDIYKKVGVYEKDISMTSFWENDSIVWSEGIKQMDLVIKDDSGGSGHAHKRQDHEKFFPTKVRLTLTQVSAGAKYMPEESPKFELRRISNSKSFSQIIAINEPLEMIGTRELTDAGISTSKSFLRRGSEEFEIPIPKDFTNVEACALSDNGLVVGYVSRAFGAVGGSVKAFVWDSRSNVQMSLPPLESDIVCHAQDISADGKRITGYSIGNEPPRMRPCVWDWQEKTKSWIPQELPSIEPNNPFLQTAHVIISPDGKRVAASITEEQVSQFVFNSSLFVWEHTEDGKWKRTKVSDEQPKLRDMNNQGTMVGSVKKDEITRACIIDLQGNITLIELLSGDESSEAYGITNSGVVVGLSDDPPGASGSPQAFIYLNGVVSPLALSPETVTSAAFAINQDGVIAGYLLESEKDDAAITGFLRIPAKR
jgi:hypothetical protein